MAVVTQEPSEKNANSRSGRRKHHHRSGLRRLQLKPKTIIQAVVYVVLFLLALFIWYKQSS